MSPFSSSNPLDTYRNILMGRIYYPNHLSNIERDLIERLLQPKIDRRLGCNDVY